MADWQISCKQKKDGRITHVGGSFKDIQPISTIMKWMDGGHTFFTKENSIRAQVYKKQHPESKRWFLTTDPDSIEENNLDFLDECS